MTESADPPVTAPEQLLAATPAGSVPVTALARAVLRAALPPTLAFGAAVTIGAAVVDGWAGAFGAALGTVLVVVFFGLELAGWRWAARRSPDGPLKVAAVGYAVKTVGLGVLLVLLRGNTAIGPVAFAVAAVGGTVVWLAGHLYAFTRSGG